jgi:hypothetical protein
MCLVNRRRTGSTNEADGYNGFLREKKQKKSVKTHGQKKARGEDSENIPLFGVEDITQASQALQDKAMVCSCQCCLLQCCRMEQLSMTKN